MRLEEIARSLLAEKYANPTPERPGAVDGPTARMMWQDRLDVAAFAHTVVQWPGAEGEYPMEGRRDEQRLA